MIKNLAIGGGSNRTLLLLALLLGLIAAILIGVYLSSLDSGNNETPAPAETRTVVVAAVDVPPLTEITAEMLTVKAVPVDLVLEGGFTSIDDVVGQKTQVAMVPGEQVLQTKVTSPDTAGVVFGDDTPLSLTIPEGMRAFTVAVSAVGAAGGLVRAGDRVDLIYSGSLEDIASSQDFSPASACYVLQNVEVLAWDSNLKQTTSNSDAAGIAAADQNEGASKATLAVSPNDAWQLAAIQKGVSGGGVDTQLWMSLRGFGDTTVSDGLPTCSVAISSNPVPGS